MLTVGLETVTSGRFTNGQSDAPGHDEFGGVTKFGEGLFPMAPTEARIWTPLTAEGSIEFGVRA